MAPPPPAAPAPAIPPAAAVVAVAPPPLAAAAAAAVVAAPIKAALAGDVAAIRLRMADYLGGGGLESKVRTCFSTPQRLVIVLIYPLSTTVILIYPALPTVNKSTIP